MSDRRLYVHQLYVVRTWQNASFDQERAPVVLLSYLVRTLKRARLRPPEARLTSACRRPTS